MDKQKFFPHWSYFTSAYDLKHTIWIVLPLQNFCSFFPFSFMALFPCMPLKKKTCVLITELTYVTMDPRYDYSVNANRAERFYPEIRKYYPNLKDGSLEPGYSGIRPKLSGPLQPPSDFVIQVISNTHLLLANFSVDNLYWVH